MTDPTPEAEDKALAERLALKAVGAYKTWDRNRVSAAGAILPLITEALAPYRARVEEARELSVRAVADQRKLYEELLAALADLAAKKRENEKLSRDLNTACVDAHGFKKRADKAEADLAEAVWLLERAMEWAAGYPLQGQGSHADHGAADDVYQNIRAFLARVRPEVAGVGEQPKGPHCKDCQGAPTSLGVHTCNDWKCQCHAPAEPVEYDRLKAQRDGILKRKRAGRLHREALARISDLMDAEAGDGREMDLLTNLVQFYERDVIPPAPSTAAPLCLTEANAERKHFPSDLCDHGVRLDARCEECAKVPPACGGCGGPHPYDTSIPSVVWNEVIRAAGLHDYLCATCILAAFARAKRSFTATLYGGGLDGTTVHVSIGGQVADDAHRIQEQNNTLRATMEEIRDKAAQAHAAACRPASSTAAPAEKPSEPQGNPYRIPAAALSYILTALESDASVAERRAAYYHLRDGDPIPPAPAEPVKVEPRPPGAKCECGHTDRQHGLPRMVDNGPLWRACAECRCNTFRPKPEPHAEPGERHEFVAREGNPEAWGPCDRIIGYFDWVPERCGLPASHPVHAVEPPATERSAPDLNAKVCDSPDATRAHACAPEAEKPQEPSR